jgi:hypothetical protein
VDIGPWPTSGGSWSWAGPNGFTSTSREIDNIALSAGANVYTATYTNTCGTKSTQVFTITTPPIVPYINVNSAWEQESTTTVTSTTAVVDLGAWPISGGSWSWTGPNGFTSTSPEIDNISLTVGTNTFVATYTNTGGVKSTQTFTVTVIDSGTGQEPCDILASDGNACVAAYSTTRALFADYNAHLYQVERASDSTYLDITTSSAGGHANAAAQNTFCANTTCTITKLYDQTANLNDLTVAGPGANVPTADSPVSATGQAVSVGGNKVWGIYLNQGEGYRNDSTTNIPVNADPEGAYEVASGTHFNQYCCFDFGNAEVKNGYASNYAPSHMDAINFSSECWFVSCPGKGPWVQVDVECCGLLGPAPTDPNDTGLTSNFITAYLRNQGVGDYYLDGGDATDPAGNISFWAGSLPSGYSPMHQEGAIVLGVGGDNSDWGVGTFFEGAITAGTYSNNALAAIQANVAAAQYALASASLAITPTAATITYGENTATLEASATFTAGTLPKNALVFQVDGGSQTPGTCSISGTTQTCTVTYSLGKLAAGSHTVYVLYGGDTNYAASFEETTLTVDQAPLTVTANNASRAVGAANPAFTASYSGFVNGDTALVLSGAPSFTTTATTTSVAGLYPITPAAGTLTAANYSFVFVNGTLSVVSAPAASVTPSATLTGSHSTGYTLTVTIYNPGSTAISNLVLTSATLGTTSGSPLPQVVGTIAAGSSASFTVNFPGSVGADGAGVAEKYSGTYTGSSFSISFRSVTLP